MAGTSRIKYPANVVPIRVMCSGRVDPEFVLDAFEKGADGVFIGGCHPGDCHYVSGNYRTRKRVIMMKKLLQEMGINPVRLRLEWVSATEGKKFATVIEEFVNEIKELGPSPEGE
ncbi:MAG: hydrogenase iron-sulfur subunit [Thermoplasmata archaeon]|nr:MAG: hydrogenase iron-sulfur subunit [Thermoplasmata archaeon]